MPGGAIDGYSSWLADPSRESESCGKPRSAAQCDLPAAPALALEVCEAEDAGDYGDVYESADGGVGEHADVDSVDVRDVAGRVGVCFLGGDGGDCSMEREWLEAVGYQSIGEWMGACGGGVLTPRRPSS